MKAASIRGLLAAVSVLALGVGLPRDGKAQQAPAASAAELAALGVWDSTVTYAKDDIVTARGSAWISLHNNNKNKVPGQTQPSTATDWQLFARGFNPTGAWSNATKYQPDDLITYLGQTYRAKVTQSNRQPPHTPSWELFAAKGEAGPNTGIGMGTASAPSISFNNDSNTGIFSPATNQIALVENGTKVFHTGHDPSRDNLGVGRGALASVETIGAQNTALGADAGNSLTTGANNVAIGYAALRDVTASDDNIAIGSGAMRQSISGANNVAIGAGAMATSTSGSNNIAIGWAAMTFNDTGSANVGIGHMALNLTSAGERNVAIGRGALTNNGSGSDNIAIGDQAGTSAASTANNNILIGHSGSGFNNAVVIGGAQTTAQIAGIHNQTSSSGIAVLVNSSGRLGTTTSSRRFKEDIADMGDVTGMLGQLRPVTFHYKQADEDGAKPLQYGLIAEEVEAVFPDLVAYDKEGRVHTVKYHLLPNFLLAGYQAQQTTIAAQANELRQQKEVNASLEARLARIEAAMTQTKAASLR